MSSVNIFADDIKPPQPEVLAQPIMYEAEIFPTSGMELEGKRSFDEWVLDTRYMRLDVSGLEELLYFYDYDSTLRTVTQIYYASLFSGGISFERSQYKMNVMSKQWYNSTWVNWCTNVDRHNACIGFAPCVKLPHPAYVGLPTVLNLGRCIIFYRQDLYGFPHFVFFEQAQTLDIQPRYIPDVTVYVERAPSFRGDIRSKICTLFVDLEFEETLHQSATAAIRLRSNPVLVLQADSKKHDPEAMISTLSMSAESSMLGDGDIAYIDAKANKDKTAQASRTAEEIAEETKSNYARLLAACGPNGTARLDSMVKMYSKTVQTSGLKQYSLPANRVLATQIMPESPDDLLVNFRVARMERVLNCFGIPLGLLSQSSSLGDGSKSTQNQEIYTMFVNTQKQKKEQILSYMYDMYDRIYQIHHCLQNLSKAVKGEATTISAKTDVVIRMNGLPEDIVLDKLYTMGALKYEAYVRFMGEKHSIPDVDFNEECEMSLKDLNGIKEEEGSASASKSSSSKSSASTSDGPRVNYTPKRQKVGGSLPSTSIAPAQTSVRTAAQSNEIGYIGPRMRPSVASHSTWNPPPPQQLTHNHVPIASLVQRLRKNREQTAIKVMQLGNRIAKMSGLNGTVDFSGEDIK